MEASVATLWRPLGAILIEWQLLSEQQLEIALAEQQRTGRRLGEVLVELDFVRRDVLISVLLEQCGLESETQSGFGSGLLTELRKRGSAHRGMPLHVVDATPPEAAAPEVEPAREGESRAQPDERRRRWRRRKEDRDEADRAEQLATAFAAVESWAVDLQRQIVEMRRLIGEAQAARQ